MKVDIFEKSWLDLVFEGKNKEYGAYQLRQETSKTTLLALFFGLLIITSAVAIPILIKKIFTETLPLVEIPTITSIKVELTKIDPIIPIVPKTAAAPPVTERNDEEQLVNPEIVRAEQANQNIAQNSENQNTSTTPEGTTGSATSTIASASAATVSVPEIGNEIVRTPRLDKLPAFPGGIDRFYKFVGENFETPNGEIEKTIKVYVSFVIEKDGTLTDIKVLRDPGYGLAQEAIRVLKSLKTKWQPGMINGQPVRTAYDLPITIKID